MNDDLKWIIGTGVTFFVFFGGVLYTTFSNLSVRMKAGNDKLADQMKAADDALHERVNRVRDEYVRRDDLDGQIRRLDKNIEDLRSEAREHTKETNRRLDTIIASLAVKKAGE